MMKLFITVFGSIFYLLLISSCTPAALGTATTNPIKVVFARDILEIESVNIVAEKTVYVQIEQPSGFFDLDNRKLNQLDKKLGSDVARNISENDIFTTGVSSWFNLIDHQLFYGVNGEFVLIDDENWSVELKKTIARRDIERVKKERSDNSDINHIRYSEWFDFVFAITPDSQASGEYFVLATIKLQGSDEAGEVVLRFKAPSNGIPKNAPKEISDDFVS